MPITESTQHKLDRVRPPRVQITYDVEIGGAVEQVELPFVLGIVADLSGNSGGDDTPLTDREFIEIDRDNFNKIMRSVQPKLSFSVPSTIPGETHSIDVQLAFSTMDDFKPANIIQQVQGLKDLYVRRQQLRDLLALIEIKTDLLRP
jgi:type VI secretion system ImpB/VipA family protein